MADLNRLIELLNSPKAGTRYDACEELRVADESSEAAVLALEKATQDTDPYVAERAKAALNADVHRVILGQLGMQKATTYDEFRRAGELADQRITKPPRGKIYTSRREKQIDFAIGFIGWFAVNSVLWIVLFLLAGKELSASFLSQSAAIVLATLCLPYTMNIGVLIYMAFNRRWLAFGWLTAIAANLAITLLVNLILYSVCFQMPFYLPKIIFGA